MNERLPLANIAGDPMSPGEDHIPESMAARLGGPSHSLLKAQVEDVLLSLSARESRVLRLRNGLDDGTARTQAEVGEIIGRSPRTVRRIERSFWAKLRHPGPRKRLADYLE